MIDSSIDSVKCSNVDISNTKISKTAGERVVFSIPREKVQQISLSHETDAKYPFCQFLFGFMLFAFGGMGLLVVFFTKAGNIELIQQESGRVVIPLVPIILWIMIGIGLWLLSAIFRVRYFLLVETENGIHKFFFGKATTLEEINQFMRKANFYFGYSISSALEDNELST